MQPTVSEMYTIRDALIERVQDYPLSCPVPGHADRFRIICGRFNDTRDVIVSAELSDGELVLSAVAEPGDAATVVRGEASDSIAVARRLADWINGAITATPTHSAVN